MADVAFGQQGSTASIPHHHGPPHQCYYGATRLMAHMGTYSPDEMNGLHWPWHQLASLRVRAAMQRHNIWAIPGSSGSQGHANGTPATTLPRGPRAPKANGTP